MHYIQINKTSPITLEEQLYLSILKAIQNDILIPDDRLPSEEMVSESFKIGKMFVKNVYVQLEKEGWLVRNPKGGTFVSQNQKYVQVLNQLPFIERSLDAYGVDYHTEINLVEIHHHEQHIRCTHYLRNRPIGVSHFHLALNYKFDTAFQFLSQDSQLKLVVSLNASILNRNHAVYFNSNLPMLVYDVMTQIYKEDELVGSILQWVHPMLGDLVLEDIREL